MSDDRNMDRLLAEAEIAAHMATIDDRSDEWKAGFMAGVGDALMAMNKMAERVEYLEAARGIAEVALSEADANSANAIQVMRQAELMIERLTAEIERLVAALDDAEEGMLEMIGYIDPYFVNKWDLSSYIMRLREAKRRA